MPNSIDANSEIEPELAQLVRVRINELRKRWRAIFRIEPPSAFGPDLLRRGIAQRIQEQHYGGLSAQVQRQLNQIVKALEKKPSGRIELPRRIKPGAILVRTWKDKSHRVTVLNDGFAFEGRVHKSLSEIARYITGTRWNGPKFFGLRPTRQGDIGQIDERPRRRGRPPAALSQLRSRGEP